MGERFERIKKRTLTIAIGLPVVIYITYQGGILFYLALAMLAILGTLELWQISKNRDLYPSLIMGLVASLFFLFQKILSNSLFFEKHFLFSIIVLLIFMEHFLLRPKKNFLINISLTLFISIYIGHFLSFIIHIRDLLHGDILLIFALFTTWMSDTVAYIFGVYFGKSHIFPSISPNKTLEGSISGILGGAICGMLFYFVLPLNPIILLVLGFFAAICGQIGDLFESLIKRNFNVKDSGNLLPGHGGILDCMDSVLFSVPALYFCFYLILST